MKAVKPLETNKNILIVSPCFAPSTLVGAARMTSLADFLSQNGYNVSAVTLGKAYYPNDLWDRPVPSRVNRMEVSQKGNWTELMRQKVRTAFAEKHYDACILSVGPFETQIFIKKECKRYGIPLILDYRDAWLFYRPYYKGMSRRNRMKAYIKDAAMLPVECRNVDYASRVVTVTDSIKSLLTNRYGSKKDKFITILNGHEDMSDYSSRETGKNTEEYRIGCIGKFIYYNKKIAMELLQAVSELRKNGYNVQVVHIGEKSDDATELVREMKLDSACYEYAGKQNYQNAMKSLSKMQASVVIYNFPEGLGTKVFDYIGMNMPIIYAGLLPSELSQFVSQFKNVIIADNKETLAAGIKKFINEKVYTLENTPIQTYSREYQNRKYQELIDDVILHHSAKQTGK